MRLPKRLVFRPTWKSTSKSKTRGRVRLMKQGPNSMAHAMALPTAVGTTIMGASTSTILCVKNVCAFNTAARCACSLQARYTVLLENILKALILRKEEGRKFRVCHTHRATQGLFNFEHEVWFTCYPLIQLQCCLIYSHIHMSCCCSHYPRERQQEAI